MTNEVILGDDELDPREEKRYRGLLDRSRKPVRTRPVTPAREDMPTFQEIHQMSVDPPDVPGIPRMTEKELTSAVKRPATSLSQDTVAGLEALAAANAAGAPPSSEDEEPEMGEEKSSTADLDAVFERVMRSSGPSSPVGKVHDDARRKQVEAGLDDISISDLLMSQDARQRVPVAKGIFAEFRSLNGHETEFAERWVWEQFHGSTSESHYALARGLVHLTLTLTSVGKQKFPEHRDEYGQVKEELFEKKHRALLKYPTFLIEALDIQRLWFVERCAKVLSVDAVGNG